LRAALGDGASADANGWRDPALAGLIGRWLEQGTAVELRGQLDAFEREAVRKHQEEVRLAAERAAEAAERAAEAAERTAEKDALTLQIGEMHQQLDRLSQRIGELDRGVSERERENVQLMQQIGQAGREKAEFAEQVSWLNRQLEQDRNALLVRQRSFRWLLGSIRAEMWRRWQGRAGA
jgi:chromosome segregation ATPase